MDLKFLKKWTEEIEPKSLIIKEIKSFRDQFAVCFKQSKLYLQINLQPENPTCFFTDKNALPFTATKSMERWNQQLIHAQLEKVSMPKNDRIVMFHFAKTDIFNAIQKTTLILELIPRYQNMILADENFNILTAKRAFSFADNPFRQILPGQEYSYPPSHAQPESEKVAYPISIKNSATLVENSPSSRSFHTMNAVFETHFYEHVFAKEIEQKRKQLLQNLQKERKKKLKKIEKLKTDLEDAKKMEKWKHFAELLKANLAILKSGMVEIKVTDYFQQDFPLVKIPLQPQLTPLENMNFYFKKYRKARDGKIKISEQIETTESELDELEKEEFEILEADWQSFFQSREEKKEKKEKRFKSLKLLPDWEIFIGRTSKENDILTTKFAKPHDFWFHSRVFRGTHIILRNYNKKSIQENLLLICARLAAYYSKAKFSENVPVDYTEIRYVRKPHSSAPGFVTYTNQKTVFVDPVDMREASLLLREL